MMAKNHRMTTARRAALKKAQAASARKRKGKGGKKYRSLKSRQRRTMTYIAIGATALAAAGMAASYKQNKDIRKANRSIHRGRAQMKVGGRKVSRKLAQVEYNQRQLSGHITRRRNSRWN